VLKQDSLIFVARIDYFAAHGDINHPIKLKARNAGVRTSMSKAYVTDTRPRTDECAPFLSAENRRADIKLKTQGMIHQDWFADEIILQLKSETVMSNPYSQSDLREELRTATAEPLLPIEKKLIAWSLSLGLALLVVLAAINHVYSVTP
jgi:hypothetical protein